MNIVKMKTKNLWILLGIIGMILISECIGEKSEKVQAGPAAE